MNKNIVVFGCDNSGKTTFCNWLKNEINLMYSEEFPEVVHSIGPNKTVEEYIEFMKENLNKDCITIFDRFPIIEEDVIGPLLRGKNAFSGIPDEILKELIEKVDVFVYCYPGFESVLNWGEREQMKGIKESASSIIVGYLSWALMLNGIIGNVLEYNYNISSFECDARWDVYSEYNEMILCKIRESLGL